MVVNLRAKKRLVARVTGVGIHRVRFDPEHLDDVSEIVTRQDVRGLISAGTITFHKITGTSKGRAAFKKSQKTKRGRKAGNKQGAKGARVGKKQVYVKKVRSLRYTLRIFKDRGEITNPEFWGLYRKIGGNTIRNKAHLRALVAETVSSRT